MEFAQSLGVSYVCRRLRLSYVQLRRRLSERTKDPKRLPLKTSFVEVPLENYGTQISGYRAELSRGSGEKLTLYLGTDLRAVLALAESLWRRGG